MADGRVIFIDEQDRVTEIGGVVEGDTIRLGGSDLAAAAGWTAKPEGLCRGDVCLPRALWPELIVEDGSIDAAALGAAAGQPVVVDVEAGLVAIGTAGPQRREAMETLDLPDVEVRDLDGDAVRLGEIEGKKLLISFASWCGCRHDLPAWQELHQELSAHDFTVVAVAVDEDPEDARPWVEEAKVTFPVVLDRDRVVCEALNIRNVPTVTWIDEHNRVVRPNDVAFSTNQFKDFHGIDSTDHLAALRRWVEDDELPLSDDDVHAHQVLPTDEEQLARVHFRAGLELHRRGRDDAALRHFTSAGKLSPDDFTIRRAAIALRGIDPFLSDEFIALWEEWSERGRPYYSFTH